MEYLVPLLILVLVVLIGAVVARGLGRRKQHAQGAAHTPAGQDPAAPRAGREVTAGMAQAASLQLTPAQHRSIYSLIARQQPVAAIKEYRVATGARLVDAAAAIAALAQFPQPSPEPPAPAATLTVADILGAAPENEATAAPAENEATAAPAERPGEATARSSYRYRAIVSHGNELREVASTRLNEAVFDRIKAMALAGNYEGAAQLLREHADIGVTEAREFVGLIRP